MTAKQRCSQALKDFFTHEQIPQDDRQAYIDQAREISATLGPDHCAAWLQAWADDARERRIAWARDRAAAEARIYSRHKPDAEPAVDGMEKSINGADNFPALQGTHRLAASSWIARPQATDPANTYAAARQGIPRPPTGQKSEQAALL